MSKIIKGIKIRMYPTEEQIKVFRMYFRAHEAIFNLSLELKRDVYKNHKVSLSQYDLQGILTHYKQQPELSGLREPPVWLLRSAIEDLIRAYDKKFKEGAGFPKPKTRNNPKRSFGITHSAGIRIEGNRLKIPKMDELIKLSKRGKKPKSESIRTMHVTLTPTNKWYVSFSYEEEYNVRSKEGLIAFDLGTSLKREKKMMHAYSPDKSYKEFHYSPYEKGTKEYKLLQKYRRKIEYISKIMDRQIKVKGKNNKMKSVRLMDKKSNRYKKLLYRKNRVYEKITNKTKYLHHHSTKKISDEFNTVKIEDMGVKWMMQQKRIGDAKRKAAKTWHRNIASSSPHLWKQQLEYKLKWKGGEMIKVDPKNTSKTCFECKTINQKVTIDMTYWTCKECKTKHHRDANASKVISTRDKRVDKKKKK